MLSLGGITKLPGSCEFRGYNKCFVIFYSYLSIYITNTLNVNSNE